MCCVKMVSKSSIIVHLLLLVENIECSIELARGKPAESNGANPSYWSASNTVDGYTNTNLKCGSCLQTEQENPAYLKVDLGDQYTINRVVIYFAKSRPKFCQDNSIDEGWKERFQKRNMRNTVIVNTSNSILGTICHRDETSADEYRNFNLFQNIPCNSTLTGRYVSIVQYHVSQESHITNPILAVCEFQVYGCRVNFYGYNCGRKCSEHCEVGKCDPDFGCLECIGRRTNADCSECSPGFYGHNCVETCGKCSDNETCDSKFGICSACADEYIPPLCKQRTSRNVELQESNNIPIGAIVGGNIGAVIVILTIIILGIILLRRNQYKQRNDRSNTKIKLANETRQTEQFYETSQRTNDEHQYSKCGDTSSTFEQTEFTIFDKEAIENVYTNVNF